LCTFALLFKKRLHVFDRSIFCKIKIEDDKKLEKIDDLFLNSVITKIGKQN